MFPKTSAKKAAVIGTAAVNETQENCLLAVNRSRKDVVAEQVS